MRSSGVFEKIVTLGSLGLIVVSADSLDGTGSCCDIVVARISSSVRSAVSYLLLTGGKWGKWVGIL